MNDWMRVKENNLSGKYDESNYIPQIRESVVKVYIEDYNKGNQWKYVNVEYEYTDNTYDTWTPNGVKEFNVKSLKLRDDNTVIVSPIKEMFTRNELISLFTTVDNREESFLEWIYDRLIHKYREDKNYDYMHKLKSIVDFTKELI